MVLEQEIIFVCTTTNSPEDSAAHEFVNIGAETINDLWESASSFIVNCLWQLAS